MVTAISNAFNSVTRLTHWWNQKTLLTKVFHASKILLFAPHPWAKTIGALSMAHGFFLFYPPIAKDLALAREFSRDIEEIIANPEQTKISNLLEKIEQFQGPCSALKKAIETLENWRDTPEEKEFVSNEFKDFVQEVQARAYFFTGAGFLALSQSPYIWRFFLSKIFPV